MAAMGLPDSAKWRHDSSTRGLRRMLFGRASAGDYERVVVLGRTSSKVAFRAKFVAPLLAIGLVALEIVDGGAHGIASLLIGADGMDHVPDHEKR